MYDFIGQNLQTCRLLRPETRAQVSVTVLAHDSFMPVTSYRDLEAWQLGMTLVEEVYSLTRMFPRDELFGLAAQLRRSAIAIPSNLAEGHRHGRNTYRHYVI